MNKKKPLFIALVQLLSC